MLDFTNEKKEHYVCFFGAFFTQIGYTGCNAHVLCSWYNTLCANLGSMMYCNYPLTTSKYRPYSLTKVLHSGLQSWYLKTVLFILSKIHHLLLNSSDLLQKMTKNMTKKSKYLLHKMATNPTIYCIKWLIIQIYYINMTKNSNIYCIKWPKIQLFTA